MSSASSNPTSSIGMAKIVVMGGIMYSARSWNNEDATLVHRLRVAYAAIHILCVTLVLYIYYVASQLSQSNGVTLSSSSSAAATATNKPSQNRATSKTTSPLQQFIYVPVAPQPFADPAATTKKSYTQIAYATHVANTARSLVGSTLFSIAMTCGLHWYKGMVTGLAIQTVLAPLTVWENPLVRAVLTRLWFSVSSSSSSSSSSTAATAILAPEHRLFGEILSLEELDATTDQVVDERGNPVKIPTNNKNNNPRLSGSTGTSNNASINNHSNSSSNQTLVPSTASVTTTTGKSFEDIVLDTWDDGSRADLTLLLQTITKQNVNVPTVDAGWTPLMILCGLHSIPDDSAASSTAAIATLLLDLGADVRLVDADGWNCFHWAMFHGHRGAIDQLLASIHDRDVVAECCQTKDKEQKTPIDIARQEGNDDMVATVQLALGEEASTPLDGTPHLDPATDTAMEPKKDQ